MAGNCKNCGAVIPSGRKGTFCSDSCKSAAGKP